MTLLIPIFLVIAIVYSMAGLAGGSSYLAALAFAGFPRGELVTLALLCNGIVSLQGSLAYAKAGYFEQRIFWPLVLSSAPFAFLGGILPVGDRLFYILLGASLLAAAFRMFFIKRPIERKIFSAKLLWFIGLPAGMALGFLAGLVGLGGGIFLGPLLILTGAASSKQAAGITAPFIFVNSFAGLLAHHENLTPSLFQNFFPLLLTVAVGGWFGSKLGARHLQPIWVQKTAAVLLSFVGLKLLGVFS